MNRGFKSARHKNDFSQYMNANMLLHKETLPKLILAFVSLIFLYACRQTDNKKVSEEKWYTATNSALCDERNGIFLDPQKLKKFGKHSPYNYTKSISGDSVKISFDFISDCCLDYNGDAKIIEDTLFLDYRLSKDTAEPCECNCDYRMEYKISRNQSWRLVRVKNILFD